MFLHTKEGERKVSHSERTDSSYKQREWEGLVLRQAQHSGGARSVPRTTVGSRLESSHVHKQGRLLGSSGTWLVSPLDNLRNRHLEINPKFQKIYRNVSSLSSELLTAIHRLTSILSLSGHYNFHLEHLRIFSCQSKRKT